MEAVEIVQIRRIVKKSSITIQKNYRGYRARKKFRALVSSRRKEVPSINLEFVKAQLEADSEVDDRPLTSLRNEEKTKGEIVILCANSHLKQSTSRDIEPLGEEYRSREQNNYQAALIIRQGTAQSRRKKNSKNKSLNSVSQTRLTTS